jgi:N-acetylglutamate synthase-like GNAT family acetyltransferase
METIDCIKSRRSIRKSRRSIRKIFVKSIAVKHNYWRKGIGSKLLKFFEEQAKKLKIKRITIPSADIEWVERFYMKNGYKPIEFLVRIKKDKLPKNYKKKYKILSERVEGDDKILYIKVRKYSLKQKEKIKKVFKPDEVLYIMEKKL